MKRLLQTAVAVIVASALTGSASAAVPCTPVPPKEWSGHVHLLNHEGNSAAVTFFQHGGCSWNGLEELNGTDGLVWDLEGHSGPAVRVALTGLLTRLGVAIWGHHLNSNCEVIEGSRFEFPTSDVDAPEEYPLSIPPEARWMAITGVRGGEGNDITMTIRTEGTDCPVPPKKKKKRR